MQLQTIFEQQNDSGIIIIRVHQLVSKIQEVSKRETHFDHVKYIDNSSLPKMDLKSIENDRKTNRDNGNTRTKFTTERGGDRIQSNQPRN